MLASWSGSGTLTAGLSLRWWLTTSTSTSAIVEVWLTEPHSCLALLVVITSPAPDSVIQKWPGPEPKISSEAKVAPPSNAARELRRHMKIVNSPLKIVEDTSGTAIWNSINAKIAKNWAVLTKLFFYALKPTFCLMLSTFCLMILHWLTVHDALRRWIYRALSALQYGFWAARGQGIQLAVYSLEIFILPGYATCHLTLSFHLTTIYRIVTIVGSTRRARDSSFTSLFIAIDQPTHSEYAELSREGKPFHTLYPKGR